MIIELQQAELAPRRIREMYPVPPLPEPILHRREPVRLFSKLCFVVSVCCAVLFVPFAVFAADAAVGGMPPEANPWWHIVLVNVLIGFGSIVLGLIGKGLTLAFDWLAEKTKISFLARVDDALMDIITEIYATQVEHAKAAAKDGKLSKEEREKFKSLAISSLKSWLGVKGIKKLGAIANGFTETSIRGKVEKAIAVSKNAGKLARSSAIAKALGAASDPRPSSASRP